VASSSEQVTEVATNDVATAAVGIEDYLSHAAGHRIMLPLVQLQRLKVCMGEGKVPVAVDNFAGGGQGLVTVQPAAVVEAMAASRSGINLLAHGAGLVSSEPRCLQVGWDGACPREMTSWRVSCGLSGAQWQAGVSFVVSVGLRAPLG
jgi:hypothetical protein